jgi:hypothetical protein
VRAAIKGALRQRHVEQEKLAVDTHGFTYLRMTRYRVGAKIGDDGITGLPQPTVLLQLGTNQPMLSAEIPSTIRATAALRSDPCRQQRTIQGVEFTLVAWAAARQNP